MPQHGRNRIERGPRNPEASYAWENLASLRKEGASFLKKEKMYSI